MRFVLLEINNGDWFTKVTSPGGGARFTLFIAVKQANQSPFVGQSSPRDKVGGHKCCVLNVLRCGVSGAIPNM